MPPVLLPQFITANGLEFGFLEAKPDGVREAPLVLLLHGFPDTAWSFEPIVLRLAAAGFHAVAPFMRGYLPTGIPADGDYRLSTLARDVIALIEHLGAERAVVVGHDWGAAAAYAAAALRPDRVRGIVTAAIPHLRRFLLRPTPGQFSRSRYMARFQWRGIEPRLMADQCAALKALVQPWSPDLDVDTALAPAWANFADKARLKAALGYYRALPAGLFSAGTWQLLLPATTVPALVIYGGQDGCVAPEMFTGQAHLFAAGVELLCFENAGHFMQIEQPEAFAEAVLKFCAKLA